MTKKNEVKPAELTQQQLDQPFQQRLGAMLTAETLARAKQVRDSQEKQTQQRHAYEKQKSNQNQK